MPNSTRPFVIALYAVSILVGVIETAAMPVQAGQMGTLQLAQRDYEHDNRRERNNRANAERFRRAEQERLRQEREYNFRRYGYYRKPNYLYAPPPVYYAPPQRPPVIDFVFPLNIR